MVANWPAIEQERFTPIKCAEKGSRELGFEISEYTIKSIAKSLEKKWPYSRTRGPKTRNDRPRRLAIYIRACVDAIKKIEKQFGESFLSAAIDTTDLDDMCHHRRRVAKTEGGSDAKETT